MRLAPWALLGCLALGQASCSTADFEETLVGRWQSEDSPDLWCEFTEEGLVRLRGDFGQAVGSYPVHQGGSARIHLSMHGRSDLPAWVKASVVRDTLILETPDGKRATFRRG